MEKKAEKNIETRIRVCPNIALTTTIRPPPLTRRLVKTLSALLGVPKIERGKSSLDEIAYYVYRARLSGFIVVYSKKKQPSRLDIYRFISGYYQKVAYILVDSVEIHSKPKICVGCILDTTQIHRNMSPLYRLMDYFKEDSCKSLGVSGTYSTCKITTENNKGVLRFLVGRTPILTLKIKRVVLLK